MDERFPTAMSDAPPHSHRSHTTAWIVTLLVALPVFYLLSVPVFWHLALKTYDHTVDPFRPLPRWLELYSQPYLALDRTPLGWPLDKYHRWCGDTIERLAKTGP